MSHALSTCSICSAKKAVHMLQEEDRKELSLRAIVGLSPESQEQVVGAAGQAEDKYKQAGHAAADQAEQGADAATAQVSTVFAGVKKYKTWYGPCAISLVDTQQLEALLSF